jgi:hypothetical protein
MRGLSRNRGLIAGGAGIFIVIAWLRLVSPVSNFDVWMALGLGAVVGFVLHKGLGRG